MSKDFFKVKKGLNIQPTDPTSLEDLEDGDIIIDSTDDNRMKVYDSSSEDFASVGTGGTSGNFLTEFEKLTPDLSNVTSVVDTATFLPIDDNNKSVKATWAASAGYIQYESAVPADVEGQGLMTVWLKTSVQGLTLSTTTDGVVQSSVPVIANNKWKQYEILYAIEGTEQGFRVEASGSVTGDVFIDEAFVGLAPAVSTTLSSKGQLQGYSTENSNIGPCTNNQVLVYDTSEATGWKCYDGLITTDYDDVPVGTVMSYGSETLPAGYLLADGQCVLKAQYAELYGVIGANTTECTLSTANDGFNVPNLENAFLRGRGGARTPFDTEGQAIQSHNHDSGVYVPTAWNKQKFGYTGSTVQRTDTNQFSQDHRSTLTGSTGGGETRPANTSVVYMIKAVGRAPITNVAQPDIAPNKAGFVTWAAFDSVIQGHLKANGDCVLKTDYPDYFKNVGTTFGECTITTTNDGVNLPDLITDNRFIRAAGGSLAVGNIQTSQNLSHNHLTVDNTTANTTNNGGGTHPIGRTGDSGTSGISGDFKYELRYVNNGVADQSPTNLSGGSESRPHNIALTPYVRMVDNDIITGTFEQIENVDAVKTAETADHLSARVNFQGGTPLQQNYKMADNSDWVTCTRPSTGSYDCSFASGLFTSPPMVHVSVRTGSSTQYIANPNTVTSTQLTFQVTNLDYVVNDVQFEIFASKDNPDVTSSIKGAVIQASEAKQEIADIVRQDIVSSDLIKIKYHSNDGSGADANTPYDFLTKVEDNYNLWNGSSFTSPKATTYNITGLVRTTSTGSFVNGVWIDGILKQYCSDNIGGGVVRLYSCEGIKVNAGQVISIRPNGSVTQDTSDDENTHHISITEIPDTESIIKNLSNQKVECQTKFLSGSVASTGLVPDLSFNNLTIGKKYKATGNLGLFRTTVNSGTKDIIIAFEHDSADLQRLQFRDPSTEYIVQGSINTPVFTATATTTTLNVLAAIQMQILGANNPYTYIELCELPDTYVETTKFD